MSPPARTPVLVMMFRDTISPVMTAFSVPPASTGPEDRIEQNWSVALSKATRWKPAVVDDLRVIAAQWNWSSGGGEMNTRSEDNRRGTVSRP